jgi:hypothetical protein
MSLDFSSFGFWFSLLIYPPNFSRVICCTQRFVAQTNLAAGNTYRTSENKSAPPPREGVRGAGIEGLCRASRRRRLLPQTSPPSPKPTTATPRHYHRIRDLTPHRRRPHKYSSPSPSPLGPLLSPSTLADTFPHPKPTTTESIPHVFLAMFRHHTTRTPDGAVERPPTLPRVRPPRRLPPPSDA